MKLFFKNILYFSISLFVILCLTSILLVKFNTAVYQYLYDYQLNKTKKNTIYSNLLIGDSSLGNAIDSDEFSRLSSQPTINSALTGFYGYAGSYNILKTTHKLHPELKNVVIMQTLEMQTRKVSMAGYVRTVNSISDFTELELNDKVHFLKNYISYIKSIPVQFPRNKESLIYNDYIKQNRIHEPDKIQKPFDKNNINPKKNKFLMKIIDYCSKNNINFIYAHGPIYQEKLEISRSYVIAVNKNLAHTGITLIRTPIGIQRNHLGDNIDHINPLYKKEYTSMYYELIKGNLIK
jgi:hypothetical protein